MSSKFAPITIAIVLLTSILGFFGAQVAMADTPDHDIVNLSYLTITDTSRIPTGTLVTVVSQGEDADKVYGLEYMEAVAGGVYTHTIYVQNVYMLFAESFDESGRHIGPTQFASEGDTGVVMAFADDELGEMPTTDPRWNTQEVDGMVNNILMTKLTTFNMVHDDSFWFNGYTYGNSVSTNSYGTAVQVHYVRMSQIESLIPLGATVIFTDVAPGTDYKLGIEYQELFSGSLLVHTYAFDNVDITFDRKISAHGSSMSDSPRPGDIGVIRYFGDFDLADGEWGEDGILDYIGVEELNYWTPQEKFLIDEGNKFYSEAKANNWFYLWYNADCMPDQILLNGKELIAGPYGYTYKVPANGGWLSAVYGKNNTYCPWHSNEVRWTVFVKPGDAATGTEQISVYSLKDPNPWTFCGRLQYQRPVYMADWVQYGMDECPYLYEKGNTYTEAVMAGAGYQRSDTRYGDDHSTEFVPFVGSSLKTLPKGSYKWTAVDEINLSDTTNYTVSLLQDQYGFYLSYQLIGGDMDNHNDIAWATFGDIVVFVPQDMVAQQFEWQNTQVYRVVRSGWKNITIHKLIWLNAPDNSGK